MEEEFSAWYDRHRNTRNSMMTTQDLTFPEGTAQVKWWMDKKTIIVKTIFLNKKHRGQGKFTALAARMLEWTEVDIVELESVTSPVLYDKLVAGGFWKEKPYYDGNLVACKE
jgi:hypothetical protein